MIVFFKSIDFENFMSYEKAHFEFDKDGIIQINGINKFKPDATLNNGAGKSTVTDAITWAITGETIRGTKNVNRVDMKTYELNDCSVRLNFDVDDKEYEIIRTRTAGNKSGLQIFIDGKDESGKGIKDTEERVRQLFPDLTARLIGSVIILGQGMPGKFTDNKPSGRKELLEIFSKSDTMINDLKSKVQARRDVLTEMQKANDTEISVNESKISENDNRLLTSKDNLSTLKDDKFFEDKKDKLVKDKTENENLLKEIDGEISLKEATLEKCRANFLNLKEQINKIVNKSLEDKNIILTDIANREVDFVNKDKDLTLQQTKITSQAKEEELKAKEKLAEEEKEIDNKTNNRINELKAEIANNNAEIKQAEKKIKEIDNTKDICPYCGRKLEGVVKPSKEPYEQIITEKTAANNDLNANIEQCEKDRASFKANIKSEFACEYERIYANMNELLKAVKIQMDEVHTNIDVLAKEKKERIDAVEKSVADNSLELKNQSNKIEEEGKRVKVEWNDLKSKKTNLDNLLKQIDVDISKIDAEKEAERTKKEFFENTIKECEDALAKGVENRKTLATKAADLDKRISVLKSFDTCLNRDMRGKLLEGVVEYIDSRCKYYSSKLFDNGEVSFELDGNDVVISYLNKVYEALSGGEKRKVDLIVQFSLRDMLKTIIGFNCNLLFADEIFDGLDSLATDKVINMISTEFRDVKSLYIISHHTDINLSYDQIINVVKDEEGISHVE